MDEVDEVEQCVYDNIVEAEVYLILVCDVLDIDVNAEFDEIDEIVKYHIGIEILLLQVDAEEIILDEILEADVYDDEYVVSDDEVELELQLIEVNDNIGIEVYDEIDYADMVEVEDDDSDMTTEVILVEVEVELDDDDIEDDIVHLADIVDKAELLVVDEVEVLVIILVQPKDICLEAEHLELSLYVIRQIELVE